MSRMLSDKLLPILAAAGYADQDTRRVIIDLQCGEFPVVHIERIGDVRVLDLVINSLGKMQVVRKEDKAT